MKKKDIMKPTSFINSVDKGEKLPKSDITLVDEAHFTFNLVEMRIMGFIMKIS